MWNVVCSRGRVGSTFQKIWNTLKSLRIGPCKLIELDPRYSDWTIDTPRRSSIDTLMIRKLCLIDLVEVIKRKLIVYSLPMPTDSVFFCNEVTNRPRYFNPFFMNKKKTGEKGREFDEEQDKETAVCYFLNFQMRGKVLVKRCWKNAHSANTRTWSM